MSTQIRILLVVVVLALYPASETWACGCSGIPTIKESMEQSLIVISGKVLSEEYWSKDKGSEILSEDFNPEGIGFTIVQLQIEHIYKTFMQLDTITIITPTEESACGFNFEIGRRYIVYAWISDKRFTKHLIESSADNLVFSTGLCTRTIEWNSKEHEDLLEETGNKGRKED